MTRGKGRLRSVTLREAQQFAGQAEEYLQSAIDALRDGRLNAATGNARSTLAARLTPESTEPDGA